MCLHLDDEKKNLRVSIIHAWDGMTWINLIAGLHGILKWQSPMIIGCYSSLRYPDSADMSPMMEVHSCVGRLPIPLCDTVIQRCWWSLSVRNEAPPPIMFVNCLGKVPSTWWVPRLSLSFSWISPCLSHIEKKRIYLFLNWLKDVFYKITSSSFLIWKERDSKE